MRYRRLAAPFGFPLVVLLIGLSATAAVAVQLQRATHAQDQERFEVAVDQLLDDVRNRIDTYISVLRAGAGVLGGTTIPTPEAFRSFTQRLDLEERYPGLQGVGFSARIDPRELPRVVAARRRAGDVTFDVWPAEPRDEYHAILYLEPLDRRNQAAIGYDMFTEPTRRTAMVAARDSGLPAASGPVTLVQEIDENKQAGFLIYVPVYEGGGVPATVAERRAQLRGFVYSPFRAGDLFAGVLGRNPRGRAGFALYDAGTQLHRTHPDDFTGRLSDRRTLDVAGRQWRAEFFSTPALEASSSRGLMPLVVCGGVAATLLLAGLAWLETRARMRAEVSERASHDHAATLGIVNRIGGQLAAELDLGRLLQQMTDAATQLAKAQFGAFFYNSVNPQGETYTLYTLSGVPREAFAQLPMPRNTDVFAATFRGDGVVRSDDITADSRYGHNAPYAGMPPGHLPVRSYLALPVKSRSGEVLGGLFFGHAEPGVFTRQAEDIVGGIAAQAAIAIDNARLYQQVQRVLASERTARAEAERVSRTKDEFLATLSHELRTPLNAVVGWAHMLNTAALDDDKRRHAVETILRNARMQSQLIEDLLDMSRIISGRLRIEMKEIDLREVIDAAISVVRQNAEAKQIDIGVTSQPGAHVVRGDAGRLQQVLWNLLTNAIKFTPAGGRIDITLRRHEDRAEIAVSDTGMGIEPSFLAHVFDRFRQADGSFTRGHGGLGLGLSIVRSLVELHDGSISVHSDGLNRGSTFVVTLPYVTGAQEPSATTGTAAASAVNDGRGALWRVYTLVVDDDRDSRELAREVLSHHGARVVTAASAPRPCTSCGRSRNARMCWSAISECRKWTATSSSARSDRWRARTAPSLRLR